MASAPPWDISWPRLVKRDSASGQRAPRVERGARWTNQAGIKWRDRNRKLGYLTVLGKRLDGGRLEQQPVAAVSRR